LPISRGNHARVLRGLREARCESKIAEARGPWLAANGRTPVQHRIRDDCVGGIRATTGGADRLQPRQCYRLARPASTMTISSSQTLMERLTSKQPPTLCRRPSRSRCRCSRITSSAVRSFSFTNALTIDLTASDISTLHTRAAKRDGGAIGLFAPRCKAPARGIHSGAHHVSHSRSFRSSHDRSCASPAATAARWVACDGTVCCIAS
jgi:hypothetical protein